CFFFQAEDGIRDRNVTGVQTCALPICHDQAIISLLNGEIDAAVTFQDARNIVVNDYEDVFKETRVLEFTEPIPNDTIAIRPEIRSEERRVGKESRHRSEKEQ